ncbi:uncharacterized protein BDZ99DRAFT_517511 [Mytilinidion resinicola]|uniref:Cyanovirin-N domain-containing protein n=1 Tax=Mytilinidion resinicola TaxID=574789 RepID=A0A6A6YW98_9PEZI|nr:uncharacterized protein BDZ99DRAFT_517511 [Mytilinidion resinicola]KAF2813236.1 hypothetical protein BDZ99DRAFT_517511 [Mytilinidion resinicola]
MSLRGFSLLGLVAAASSQSAVPTNFDFRAAAQSISAELSSPSFVPYSRPNQKIEEFIAIGDSYTAGTGANGNTETMAGDACRCKRSYPMQMSTDADNWEFINGDRTLPRFSFPAYTGDTTVEVVKEQLKMGDYKENNKDLPRAQPFGKPQLAVHDDWRILNDCVYRDWKPGDCQETLQGLQKEIDDGSLRDKINVALYAVAHAGRQAGGANPRESFQVYVLSYITFFNKVTTACNKFSWAYWWWMTTPKLTTDLRKQLNGFTRAVNAVIKAAAQDLERMGVIFIEDMDRPGDPDNPYAAGTESPGQVLLDFVFPAQNKDVANVSEASPPPWEWEGADKYPTFEALLAAIQKEGNFTTSGGDAVPFNVVRSFHPKGTAYGKHSVAVFSAMVENRDVVASGAGGKYTERCKDVDIKGDHLLVATCTNKDGQEVRTQEALGLCLRYDGGALIPADNGQYTQNCHGCFFNGPESPDHNTTLWCVCKNDKDPYIKSASVKLDDFMTVKDDGYVKCFGHISAPTSLKRWERGSW